MGRKARDKTVEGIGPDATVLLGGGQGGIVVALLAGIVPGLGAQVELHRGQFSHSICSQGAILATTEYGIA